MEYVDLGLSVKWAVQNIGAECSADRGNFFAWGETRDKAPAIYDWSNLAYWTGWKGITIGRPTKYKGRDYSVLTPEDDAATVNLGEGWRTPTREEFQELLDGCEWRWDAQKNSERHKIRGFTGTSKVNRATIFFPLTGHRYLPPAETGYEYSGNYWSSTIQFFEVLGTKYYEHAYVLGFDVQIDKKAPRIRADDRRIGLPVRAVFEG